MKKKKFLKKYGEFTVQLFCVSLNEGLNFSGTTHEDQQILVNLTGDLGDMSSDIYTEDDYSINYIVENFPEFDIGIYIDTVEPPYMISCLIPHKER